MDAAEMLEAYGHDTLHKAQAIFASLFILQNRMQTACEKLQTEITMKQWMMLAMTESCPEPKTLTRIGNLMGCSRQNIKKLAMALERKGFVRLHPGDNHSLCVELTQCAAAHDKAMAGPHLQTLCCLFADLSEQEIDQLFHLYVKLYSGLQKVEAYAKEQAQSLIRRK